MGSEGGLGRHLVIAIGGLHGTGKSTYAKAIAREFGLRHASAGELFRALARERGMSLEEFTELARKDPEVDRLVDERTREEARRGGVVIDGMLAPWMAGEYADVKICLVASDEVRFRRIAERDGLSFEEARAATLAREEAERERYKRYYGIDVGDLSVYDIIFDTESAPIERSSKLLIELIKAWLEARERAKAK